MNMSEIIAVIAACISMVSNIPQVYKIRKRHSTKDLHFYTFVLHFLSAVLWSVYGFLLNLYILGGEAAVVALLNFLILLGIIRDRYIYVSDT